MLIGPFVLSFVNLHITMYVTHLCRDRSPPVIRTSLCHVLHEFDMVFILSIAVSIGLKLSVLVQSSTQPHMCWITSTVPVGSRIVAPFVKLLIASISAIDWMWLSMTPALFPCPTPPISNGCGWMTSLESPCAVRILWCMPA